MAVELSRLIHIQQTPSGWINMEVLEYYILNVFVPYVDSLRKECNCQGKIVLLILDGHSSRLNPNLWSEVARHYIIVLCLPAHTSNRLAALDLTVNGQLKNLMHTMKKFPSKTQMKTDFSRWIRSLYDTAYKALSPEIVSKGFELAYIKSPYITDEQLRAKCRREVLDNADVLPPACPADLRPVRRNNVFAISGKELTSPEVQKEWREYLAEKKKSPKELRSAVDPSAAAEFERLEDMAENIGGDKERLEEYEKAALLNHLNRLEGEDGDEEMEWGRGKHIILRITSKHHEKKKSDAAEEEEKEKEKDVVDSMSKDDEEENASENEKIEEQGEEELQETDSAEIEDDVDEDGGSGVKVRMVQTRSDAATAAAALNPGFFIPQALFERLPPLLQKLVRASAPALLHGNRIVQTHTQFFAEIRAKGLDTLQMSGPLGACLFTALAFLLFGSSDLHALLRKEICDYMEEHRVVFAVFCGLDVEAFEEYLRRMRRLNTWGTYVEMHAASIMSGRTIEVLSDCNNNIDLSHININEYPADTLFVANYMNRHFEPCVPLDLSAFPGYLHFRHPFSSHFLFALPLPPYPNEEEYIGAHFGVGTEKDEGMEREEKENKQPDDSSPPPSAPAPVLEPAPPPTPLERRQKRKRSPVPEAHEADPDSATDQPTLKAGGGSAESAVRGRVQRKRKLTEKAIAMKEEEEEKKESKRGGGVKRARKED